MPGRARSASGGALEAACSHAAADARHQRSACLGERRGRHPDRPARQRPQNLAGADGVADALHQGVHDPEIGVRLGGLLFRPQRLGPIAEGGGVEERQAGVHRRRESRSSVLARGMVRKSQKALPVGFQFGS